MKAKVEDALVIAVHRPANAAASFARAPLIVRDRNAPLSAFSLEVVRYENGFALGEAIDAVALADLRSIGEATAIEPPVPLRHNMAAYLLRKSFPRRDDWLEHLRPSCVGAPIGLGSTVLCLVVEDGSAETWRTRASLAMYDRAWAFALASAWKQASLHANLAVILDGMSRPESVALQALIFELGGRKTRSDGLFATIRRSRPEAFVAAVTEKHNEHAATLALRSSRSPARHAHRSAVPESAPASRQMHCGHTSPSSATVWTEP